MSSSFPPATPPLPNPAETAPPPEQSPSSPGNVDTAPPPSPVVPIQVPLPALSPPQSSPSPLVALPPLLPTVSPILSPPPTLSPLSPPPPQPPLSTPQPPPQAPVIPPTPMTKDIPPPIVTTPPITSPPLLTSPFPPISKPKTRPSITTPRTPTPPLTSSPTPAVRQPNTWPITTKPGPSEPALPASPIPAVRQTKSSSTTTQPGPLEPGPSESGPLSPPSLPASPIPAARQTQSGPTTTTKPGPSQPPAALPVPQTPGGGAWLPSTSLPPSILPSIPGTPTVENSPFVGDSNTGASSSSSSSSLVPSGGNIGASTPSSGGSSGVVVGVIIGGVLLLVLGVVFGILATLCKRRKKKFADDGSGKMHAASFKGFEDKTSLPQYVKQGPKIPENQTTSKAHSTVAGPTVGMGTHLSSGSFAYEELAIATSGFSDQNLLGQGGFGYVYKGVLPNGKEIAVKQLKTGGHQGEREFQAEVETISQVHHKHLVSLVGYCISGVERLLVYEFVANNTLDFHLHGKEQPVMDWPTRMKIAIGSAKGLAYLHEDCSPSIIHRDIKAANILLDFNFEAKVSDFGLAKIFSSSNPLVTHMTTRVVGTFGYLAPEYASSGKVTDKSDVYSYGVVLLELITGCPPISNFGPATSGSLVNWARPLLAQAIADGNFDTLADSRLQSNYNVDEMISMVSCAAACVRLSSWRRPRMSQVIRALEGNLSASELDDGVKPGHSSMHFPYESLDFDARNYIDDMKRMALASSYSDNTSDYGLNASTSSTDTSKHIC